MTRRLSAILLLGSSLLGAQSPPGPMTKFAESKAEALLRDRLPCLGCHRLNGEGGGIGPDLTTVRERRSPEYIAAMIADPQRMVPGSPMPRTLMPASTREVITRYLSTRPGNAGTSTMNQPSAVPGGDVGQAGSGGSGGGATAAAARSGESLYASLCAACHGPSGGGDGPNAALLPVKPARHSDRAAMSKRPDDSLFDTIASGGEIMGRSPRMPAYGATLTSAEIRGLVRHIRSLCRCDGPAWSRQPGTPR